MTREKEVERYFVKQVEKHGGKAYKWVSPGSVGVPDRIVLFRCRGAVFVELKAPGRKLSKQQVRQHAQLERFHKFVQIVDSKEAVDEFIRYYGEI